MVENLTQALRTMDGYIECASYRSISAPDLTLTLSTWRDEKALVRWRTEASHYQMQLEARKELFSDYHLQVGQLTRDTHLPRGYRIQDHRLDATEAGGGTTMTQLHATCPLQWMEGTAPRLIAQWMGLDSDTPGLVDWDIFESFNTPGRVVLIALWSDEADAKKFEYSSEIPTHARLQRVRVIRDYSKNDRREAPQYLPDAPG